MRTAEELTSAFYTVSDHPAAAVLAHRSQLVNRTFETVKDMPVPGSDDLETERVFVTADLAFRHACETAPLAVWSSVTATGLYQFVYDPSGRRSIGIALYFSL